MLTQIDAEHIGKCVRVAKAARDLSTSDLADRLGVTPGAVRQYQQGQIYDVRTLWRIAQVTGHNSLDEFLQLDDLML